MDISILKKLGFSDRDARIYLSLVCLGPSSVRTLAKQTEVNRGSVYESLKELQEKGVVDFHEKETKQYFVAEDPSKLYDILELRSRELNEVEKKLKETVAELKSVYDRGGARPVARYYEKGDIKKILEEVLEKCEQSEENEYRIYSDSNLRECLYEGFESFSDARVAKGTRVKAIAIGSGGELRGLDKRKWLPIQNKVPTYIIIYAGNTAYLSLNAQGDLVGVVIENEGVYETQKGIFDSLWERLEEEKPARN